MLHEATSGRLIRIPAVLPGCLQLDDEQGQQQYQPNKPD